jgi:hypothetical protein
VIYEDLGKLHFKIAEGIKILVKVVIAYDYLPFKNP